MGRPRISQKGLVVRKNADLTPELSDKVDTYLQIKGLGFSELIRLLLERHLFLESDSDAQISQERKEIEALGTEEDELRKQLEGIRQRRQELSLQSSEREKLIAFEKRQKEEEEAEKSELEKLKVEYEGYPKEQRDSAWKRVLAKTKPEERRSETDKMRLVVQELKQGVIA